MLERGNERCSKLRHMICAFCAKWVVKLKSGLSRITVDWAILSYASIHGLPRRKNKIGYNNHRSSKNSRFRKFIISFEIMFHRTSYFNVLRRPTATRRLWHWRGVLIWTGIWTWFLPKWAIDVDQYTCPQFRKTSSIFLLDGLFLTSTPSLSFFTLTSRIQWAFI